MPGDGLSPTVGHSGHPADSTAVLGAILAVLGAILGRRPGRKFSGTLRRIFVNLRLTAGRGPEGAADRADRGGRRHAIGKGPGALRPGPGRPCRGRPAARHREGARHALRHAPGRPCREGARGGRSERCDPGHKERLEPSGTGFRPSCQNGPLVRGPGGHPTATERP